MRLQHGDLRIVWESDGRAYEPDFIAVQKMEHTGSSSPRYLLVGERDVAEARGSWAAVKKLGR